MLLLLSCGADETSLPAAMSSQTAADGGATPPGDSAEPSDAIGPVPDPRQQLDANQSDVPESSDSAADAEEPPLSDGFGLLSLNLHCLKISKTPFADNAARFDAIAQFVVERDVGVLALQEVCLSADEDAVALLLDRLGPAWEAHYSTAHLAWEGTDDEAEEGLAILSREGLEDVSVVSHAVQGPLKRISVCGRITIGELGVWVCSFHFDHQAANARLMQARELAMAGLVMAEPSLDVVLAGDMNARAGKPAHDAVLAAGYLDQSADLNTTRIDHVLVHRGARWRAATAELVLQTPAVSDHPGVWVHFVAAEPEPTVVTRVQVQADAGLGHYLALRGDRAPLTWGSGWPMIDVGASSWRTVLTEWTEGPAKIKSLRDDVDWQLGDDIVIDAGSDTSFPANY